MVLDVARRIAAERPDAMVPCPGCGASLRASNLESHLAKVHPGTGAHSDRVVLRGKDRRIVRFGLAVLVLGAAGAGGLLAAGVEADSFVVPVGIATAVLLLFFVGFGEFGSLPARLIVEQEHVTLRWGLGLRVRRVRRPARVEVGRFVIKRPSPTAGEDVHTSVEHPGGTYLNVRRRRRRGIVVVCSTSTELRKHWKGWQQGKKRAGCEIVLDRPDFVALQYALADGGELSLRAG